MARIATETEANGRTAHPVAEDAVTAAQAISEAARTLADEARVRYVVVFTRSGASAHLISKERPSVPILAFTPDARVARCLSLWWGVTPLVGELLGTTEALIEWVDVELRASGLAQMGDTVVIMGGMPVVRRAQTNFIKLHRIGEA